MWHLYVSHKFALKIKENKTTVVTVVVVVVMVVVVVVVVVAVVIAVVVVRHTWLIFLKSLF